MRVFISLPIHNQYMSSGRTHTTVRTRCATQSSLDSGTLFYFGRLSVGLSAPRSILTRLDINYIQTFNISVTFKYLKIYSIFFCVWHLFFIPFWHFIAFYCHTDITNYQFGYCSCRAKVAAALKLLFG